MDSDGDGVSDTVDECPDTPAGGGVDSQGCSTQQFCNQVDLGRYGSGGRFKCLTADWRDNEWRLFPEDCTIKIINWPWWKPENQKCAATERAD